MTDSMRRAVQVLTVVAGVLLALGLLACGSGGDTSEGRTSAKELEELVGPKIVPPDGPPPKRLAVEDLKTGSGPVARRGDQVGVNYVTFFYDTGDQVGRRWLAYPPAVFRLGDGNFPSAVERSIEGMRKGGQREMTLPARLIPSGDAMIYVIALASVGPPGGES